MTIPTNLLDTWRDMYSLNLMDDGPPQYLTGASLEDAASKVVMLCAQLKSERMRVAQLEQCISDYRGTDHVFREIVNRVVSAEQFTRSAGSMAIDSAANEVPEQNRAAWKRGAWFGYRLHLKLYRNFRKQQEALEKNAKDRRNR